MLTSAVLGDDTLLLAARHQARVGFNANRVLSADDPEVAKQIKHATEVTQILRQNLVQGRPVEGEEGKYGMNHEQSWKLEGERNMRMRLIGAIPR